MGARTHRIGVVLVVVLTLLAVSPTLAQSTPDLKLPAGTAYSGFDLWVYIDGGTQVFKEFRDKDGNVVRTLQAGKGSALTFENMSTGETLSLQPNGSVTRTTFNADGSVTVVSTGHNVLILFPADVPAGPSTIQYVGRLVYTVDTNGIFTVLDFKGRSTDICASLSS